MSASTLSTSRGERGGVLTRVKNAWTHHVEKTACRDEQRATIAALAELDDAALADIGLHRSQIWSIAASLDERPGAAKR